MEVHKRNSYIAIIGDIKESKKIAERKSTQLMLNGILDRINSKYETSISAKFIITLGDEFQGLLCDAKVLIDIIEEIQREMYPVKIRFGIGFGKITTDINSEMALGADGPAYYKAREAIQRLKKNEQQNKIQPSDIRIEIEEDMHLISAMLNTILTMITMIQTNWSDRQREIIFDFDNHKGSQKECASRLGISQSSVQRGLIKGNYYAYYEAKETVKNVLREYGEIHV